jgi:hypothetical protein
MSTLLCLVHVSTMSLTSRRHRGHPRKILTMLTTNQSRNQIQVPFPNLMQRWLPMLGQSVLRADPLRLLSLAFGPLCSYLYPCLSHVNRQTDPMALMQAQLTKLIAQDAPRDKTWFREHYWSSYSLNQPTPRRRPRRLVGKFSRISSKKPSSRNFVVTLWWIRCLLPRGSRLMSKPFSV